MRNPGRLGRYEIRGVLGQGGFATVFRAWDPALGREVALKSLRSDLSNNPELRARFLAEARALARLHNPHIVAVHDVGEAAGQPFFAMELIAGRTLAEAIAAGFRPAAAQLAGMFADLAAAVDYLHAAGMVHRDIKAANIMLDPAGRLVLMDFGIARAMDGTQFTRTGVTLGTPEYMAPEQVRGAPVGPPADVYALGVLAYHLLAGRPPFVGDTGFVLHGHAYEPPPPLQNVRPGLDPAVYAAVSAALAKDPGDRPASAGALARALAGEPLPRTPTQRLRRRPTAYGGQAASPGRRRLPYVAGFVAAALLAAAMVIVVRAASNGSVKPLVDNAAAGRTAQPLATVAALLTSTPAAPATAPPTAAIQVVTVTVVVTPPPGRVASAAPGTAPPTAPPSPPRFHTGDFVRASAPNGCLLVQTEPSPASPRVDCIADRANVQVLSGPVDGSDGGTWWQIRPWQGGQPQGWARDANLLASPDCNQYRDAARCGSASSAPPAATMPARVATTASVPLASVAGDWQFTDYIRYGPQKGSSYSFHVRLSQQGATVTGTSDTFTLNGVLSGRTLRATYGQGGTAGEFTWTFTPDGTRFEGTYTNTVGNGGNSYGGRTAGSISTVDQATVTIVGPAFSGGQARVGDDTYICFTVSRPAHVTLRGVVSGQEFFNNDDDGTGNCVGPYAATLSSADAAGRATYQITMSVSGRTVAQGSDSLQIVR